MASSSAGSDDITVRILASFFLTTTADKTSSGNTVSTAPIHKEKFNVPLFDEHKELYKFLKHFKTYTGLEAIAKKKGLGENPEINIAKVQKAGSGIDTSSTIHKMLGNMNLTNLSEETACSKVLVIDRVTV